MANPSDLELAALGAALYMAQRLEFTLYGLAAHAAHTPAGQSEKRFRNLTAETFLRGNGDDLKATLGQLVTIFGDTFLLSCDELERFYKDRNLIVHSYVRTFHSEIRGAPARDDGLDFLGSFLHRAEEWTAILGGLLFTLKQAAARKEGRVSELVITEKNRRDEAAYHRHAEKHLKARGRAP